MLIVAIAAAAAVALVVAYVVLLDHRTVLQVSEAEDAGDPLKRWARGAYALVNGKFDVGRGETDAERRASAAALARDWDITEVGALQTSCRQLAATPSGNPAWDHVRRIVMLRLAAGSGLISDADSWREIAASSTILRARYQSWDQLVADYRTALAAWSNNDQERMAMFALYAKDARTLHQAVPFR